MRRSAGQILGQTSKGETTRLKSCNKCDKCGRHYKKNWMQVYWKSLDPPRRGYLCPYCDMDKRGLSLRGGIKEMNMMLFHACGGDPKYVLGGYQPFGGSVPSGQVDIDRVPDDQLERIMDLQIQNQALAKKLAQAEIPSHEEHIEECIKMIDELDVPFKDEIIKRLRDGLKQRLAQEVLNLKT